MATANAEHLRPSERVYHAWVAIEHLVSHGKSERSKDAAIPLIANVITLNTTSAWLAMMHRRLLAALHVAGCVTPGNTAVLDAIEFWFGSTDERERYERRNPGRACPRSEIGAEGIQPTESQSVLAFIGGFDQLMKTADAIRLVDPLTANQIEEAYGILGDGKKFLKSLQERRFEASSVLNLAYSVRNRVVHEADPLGFEEAPGLEDLYDQMRILIDPVIAALLREVQRSPHAPLAHAIFHFAAQLDELLERCKNSQTSPWWGTPTTVLGLLRTP